MTGTCAWTSLPTFEDHLYDDVLDPRYDEGGTWGMHGRRVT